MADELLTAKSSGAEAAKARRRAAAHEHPDGGRARSGAQFRADLGARRLRRRRGDEGAAARHGRHALQRQRRRSTSELALKTYARDHDLMVMGPDCGTAIINGVPLGFANVVRRGPIGVVGASGTGTQEVTVRIHQLGSGVSQALGTGGHDLAKTIGGISMLHGLAALDDGLRHTEVIVLVSKPPAPEVAAARCWPRPRRAPSRWSSSSSAPTRLRSRATASTARRTSRRRPTWRWRSPTGASRPAAPITLSERDAANARRAGASDGAEPALRARHLFRRHLLLRGAAHPRGARASRPSPTRRLRAIPRSRAIGKSRENTIIDMGDDEFTQGRPHPMIDPTLRDARIRDEVADPTTAVVLFDVVLGYGSADDPIAACSASSVRPGPKRRAAGRNGRVHRLRLRHRPGSAELGAESSPA